MDFLDRPVKPLPPGGEQIAEGQDANDRPGTYRCHRNKDRPGWDAKNHPDGRGKWLEDEDRTGKRDHVKQRHSRKF